MLIRERWNQSSQLSSQLLPDFVARLMMMIAIAFLHYFFSLLFIFRLHCKKMRFRREGERWEKERCALILFRKKENSSVQAAVWRQNRVESVCSSHSHAQYRWVRLVWCQYTCIESSNKRNCLIFSFFFFSLASVVVVVVILCYCTVCCCFFGLFGLFAYANRIRNAKVAAREILIRIFCVPFSEMVIDVLGKCVRCVCVSSARARQRYFTIYLSLFFSFACESTKKANCRTGYTHTCVRMCTKRAHDLI